MIWVNEPIKFVKVMKVEDKGKYVKATLSTSEKKQDGTYEYSNWFSTFVGNSVDKAKKLNEGDKITVTKAKLTNVYNKEKKQSYTNMTVFAFEGGEKKADDDFSFGGGFEDFQQIEDEDSVPF